MAKLGAVTSQDKVLLVAGVVTVAAIGALIVGLAKADKPAPKKNFGITVGPQCSTYEVTDSATISETISRLVDNSAALGAIDPFAATSTWLRGAAGQCKSFPDQARNPGEASLYREIFLQIIETMRTKQLLSTEMHDTYVAMIDTWARAQGAEVE